MQDQRIEKIAAVAVNITKVLVIIYLGLVEVFKIGKSLRKILVTDKRNFSVLISSYLSRYSSIPILPLPKEYFAKYTIMPYISDRNIPRILTFPGVNIPITANTFLHKLSFLSASETD